VRILSLGKLQVREANEEVFVEPLHCLIANIPQAMLVDIVQRIAEETENIKVVGRVSSIAELPAILSNRPIDVLIIGMEKFVFPQICSDMLKTYARLVVVGLVDDGRMAAVYLNDISSQEVTNIIGILGKR
jgi:hypothetical protein